MMKTIRYAVWLPLVHLAIMTPLISLEEARSWKFTAQQQAAEDDLRAHPPKPKSPQNAESQIGWDPYYEYRPPISVNAIYTVELPAAFLIRWCGHPPGTYTFSPPYNETWCRLFGLARVRTRIVFLDSLLLAAIYAQWWLVGWRLDRLHLQGKPTRLIYIPALVITIAGGLGALFSRAPDILELIAVLACFLALLSWLMLIATAATAVCRMGVKRFRGASASP